MVLPLAGWWVGGPRHHLFHPHPPHHHQQAPHHHHHQQVVSHLSRRFEEVASIYGLGSGWSSVAKIIIIFQVYFGFFFSASLIEASRKSQKSSDSSSGDISTNEHFPKSILIRCFEVGYEGRDWLVRIIFPLFHHLSVPSSTFPVSVTIFSPFQVSVRLTWSDVTKLITQINFPSVAIQKFSLRSIKMSG